MQRLRLPDRIAQGLRGGAGVVARLRPTVAEREQSRVSLRHARGGRLDWLFSDIFDGQAIGAT